MKREAESQNQLLWDRLQIPSVQLLAASRVICEFRLRALPMWVLNSSRLKKLSSQSGLLTVLSEISFSYIQLESILLIYDSCLSFPCCALLWGAHLSSLITLQVGRARLLWDPPEAVLYSGWSSPDPFSSALSTSPPAPTNLMPPLDFSKFVNDFRYQARTIAELIAETRSWTCVCHLNVFIPILSFAVHWARACHHFSESKIYYHSIRCIAYNSYPLGISLETLYSFFLRCLLFIFFASMDGRHFSGLMNSDNIVSHYLKIQ